MRISDWSSDVCSSDLAEADRFEQTLPISVEIGARAAAGGIGSGRAVIDVESRPVAVPRRRDRRPVEGRIADILVAIGVADADLQRIDPVIAVEVIFGDSLEREFLGVIVLEMRLNEWHPVLVRVDRKSTRLNSSH